VDSAQATLRRLVTRVTPLRPLPRVETYTQARAALAAVGAGGGGTSAGLAGDAAGDKAALAYLDQIDEAISLDLATPKVLAALQEALRDSQVTPAGLRVVVAAADALLGLRLADLDQADLDRRSATDLDRAEREVVERLVAERTQARSEKNWHRADEIRTELDHLGVQVTDTPTGPTWHLR
jgi:cysteinyl-tRNA synthetase